MLLVLRPKLTDVLSELYLFCFPMFRDPTSFLLQRYWKSRGMSHYTTVYINLGSFFSFKHIRLNMADTFHLPILLLTRLSLSISRSNIWTEWIQKQGYLSIDLSIYMNFFFWNLYIWVSNWSPVGHNLTRHASQCGPGKLLHFYIVRYTRIYFIDIRKILHFSIQPCWISSPSKILTFNPDTQSNFVLNSKFA